MPEKLNNINDNETTDERFSSALSDMLDEPLSNEINLIYKNIMSNREKIIEAFIAETGLKPTECEVVEKHLPNEIVFYIRKRI